MKTKINMVNFRCDPHTVIDVNGVKIMAYSHIMFQHIAGNRYNISLLDPNKIYKKVMGTCAIESASFHHSGTFYPEKPTLLQRLKILFWGFKQ